MDGPHRFELSGGALALDFANTWADRESGRDDHLGSYPDLLAFAEQAGIASVEGLAGLRARADREPAAAAAAFEAAVVTREAIYGLLSAAARGRVAASEHLERLNAVLPEALAGLRLAPAGDAYGWTGAGSADDLGALLRPIVRDASRLLTAPELLARVRECDGARCTWLFLDTSRNRSRRWCSMESCGNRAKARRHRIRQREEA